MGSFPKFFGILFHHSRIHKPHLLTPDTFCQYLKNSSARWSHAFSLSRSFMSWSSATSWPFDASGSQLLKAYSPFSLVTAHCLHSLGSRIILRGCCCHIRLGPCDVQEQRPNWLLIAQEFKRRAREGRWRKAKNCEMRKIERVFHFRLNTFL